MLCFVRNANRFSDPGLQEQLGGGRLSKSSSRCVLPMWNKHDGKITTIAAGERGTLPLLRALSQ